MRILPFVLAVVLLAACSNASTKPAAGGTPAPKESAGDAAKRQIGFVSKGQYGREWDELHPAQQAFIPRDKYSDCVSAAASRFPAIEGGTVQEQYADPIKMATVPEHDAMAVTMTIHLSGGHSQVSTFHEVLVNGAWKWIVNDSAVEAYKAGRCP